MNREFTLDASRRERTGLDEAIFCAGKSLAQIEAILTHAESAGRRLLLTRLDPADHAALPAERNRGTRLRPRVADCDPGLRGPARRCRGPAASPGPGW